MDRNTRWNTSDKNTSIDPQKKIMTNTIAPRCLSLLLLLLLLLIAAAVVFKNDTVLIEGECYELYNISSSND